MEITNIAATVAGLIAAAAPGTRVTVWSDGEVTRSTTSATPVIRPGSPRFPVAFFVAGVDRPEPAIIEERLQRALGPVRAA